MYAADWLHSHKHSRNTKIAAAAHAVQLSPHPISVQLDVTIAGSVLKGRSNDIQTGSRDGCVSIE